MPSYYDAYGRPLRTQISGTRQAAQPRPAMNQAPGRTPTLDDYQRLVEGYTQLKEQSTRLAEQVQERDQRIGETEQRLQQVQAELDETKAALFRCKERNGDEEIWKDRFIKLQAEMENLRKRTEQRYADAATENRHRILMDMLPLADHLELALQHGEKLTDPAAVDFLGNIQATQQAFLNTLKRYGIEPVVAAGQPFDPNQHEAAGHIPSPDVPADHVAHVLQTGYAEGDRLLRPARVMVSSGESSG